MRKVRQLRWEYKLQILERHFVRWHMTLLLAATIASGLLLDKAMLLLGFGTIGWRYALSVLGAYGAFFLLVRMWIWYAAGVAPSLPDLSGVDGDVPGQTGSSVDGGGGLVHFGGGDAGGAGASDSFDVPDVDVGGVSVDVGDVGGDDGIWVVLVLAVLLAVICGAGVYVIYMAPEILPEVALEVALGAGLVKGLRKAEPDWGRKLLWRTWIPLVIVLVVAFLAGWFIQGSCPQATTARAALSCAAAQ